MGPGSHRRERPASGRASARWSSGFNGARLSSPGKAGEWGLAGQEAVGASMGPGSHRRERLDALKGAGAVWMLQWGPALIAGKGGRRSPRVRGRGGASMGPGSHRRERRPRRSSSAMRSPGFNGARLSSPGKAPDLVLRVAGGAQALQWGPALIAGKSAALTRRRRPAPFTLQWGPALIAGKGLTASFRTVDTPSCFNGARLSSPEKAGHRGVHRADSDGFNGARLSSPGKARVRQVQPSL